MRSKDSYTIPAHSIRFTNFSILGAKHLPEPHSDLLSCNRLHNPVVFPPFVLNCLWRLFSGFMRLSSARINFTFDAEYWMQLALHPPEYPLPFSPVNPRITVFPALKSSPSLSMSSYWHTIEKWIYLVADPCRMMDPYALSNTRMYQSFLGSSFRLDFGAWMNHGYRAVRIA